MTPILQVEKNPKKQKLQKSKSSENRLSHNYAHNKKMELYKQKL